MYFTTIIVDYISSVAAGMHTYSTVPNISYSALFESFETSFRWTYNPTSPNHPRMYFYFFAIAIQGELQSNVDFQITYNYINTNTMQVLGIFTDVVGMTNLVISGFEVDTAVFYASNPDYFLDFMAPAIYTV